MESGIRTKVGQDVVCYCTRCRIDLNHRVVAQVDGLAKRVICLTCRSEHQFRPRKGSLSSESKKTEHLKRLKKTKEIKLKPNIWGDLKNRMSAAEVVHFNMTQKFKQNDCLGHPTFGIGFVQNSLDRTITVLFETGLKTLAHNR